jgi:hypothetical protein
MNNTGGSSSSSQQTDKNNNMIPQLPYNVRGARHHTAPTGENVRQQSAFRKTFVDDSIRENYHCHGEGGEWNSYNRFSGAGNAADAIPNYHRVQGKHRYEPGLHLCVESDQFRTGVVWENIYHVGWTEVYFRYEIRCIRVVI